MYLIGRRSESCGTGAKTSPEVDEASSWIVTVKKVFCLRRLLINIRCREYLNRPIVDDISREAITGEAPVCHHQKGQEELDLEDSTDIRHL